MLTGHDLRLITKTDRITARDSIEYWEKRNLAVARGDAIVARGDKRLRADTLTAYFQKNREGQSEMRRIDALNNVVISTPTEIVRAAEGVYDVPSGIAYLNGSVKITRGQNQLNGENAEVNLNTGVSRLYGSGQQNVKGYLVPDDTKKGTRAQHR